MMDGTTVCQRTIGIVVLENIRMYDKLIKQLKGCADCLCGECPYKDEATKRGNFVPCMNKLMAKATDAIEELDDICQHQADDLRNLKSQRMVTHGKRIDAFDHIGENYQCSDYDELLKVAKAMHTWIFLNSVDEQEAYDECGLTDEMNAVLGYAGSFTVIPADKDGET